MKTPSHLSSHYGSCYGTQNSDLFGGFDNMALARTLYVLVHIWLWTYSMYTQRMYVCVYVCVTVIAPSQLKCEGMVRVQLCERERKQINCNHATLCHIALSLYTLSSAVESWLWASCETALTIASVWTLISSIVYLVLSILCIRFSAYQSCELEAAD